MSQAFEMIASGLKYHLLHTAEPRYNGLLLFQFCSYVVLNYYGVTTTIVLKNFYQSFTVLLDISSSSFSFSDRDP